MKTKKDSPLGFIILIVIILIVVMVTSIVMLQNIDSENNIIESQPVNSQKLEKVTVTEFSRQIDEEEDAIILDIRTPAEFSQGRIEDSINIDYYSPDFRQQLSELDKTANYKMYCNSGNRSGLALMIMEDLGFENVSELRGGVQAWLNSGEDVCISC